MGRYVKKHNEIRKIGSAVTVCNISCNALLPGPEWHPLDGVPAPEYVPPQWDGPHVGMRMVDAFRTLAALPGGGRGNSGGFWPEVWHDWSDLLAQQGADAGLKEEVAREANRARLRPSAQEVGRMELVISWPGRYIDTILTARIVQRVALYRSRDMDMEYVARRMKHDAKQLRKANRLGLDLIAAGLRRDGVPVF